MGALFLFLLLGFLDYYTGLQRNAAIGALSVREKEYTGRIWTRILVLKTY